MHGRTLITGLAATTVTAFASPFPGTAAPARMEQAVLGSLLVARLRDALLGGGPGGAAAPVARRTLRWRARRLRCLPLRPTHRQPAPPGPRRPRARPQWKGHRPVRAAGQGLPAGHPHARQTRRNPLGWIAADRARQFANAADDALAVAEAARQAAVLARRAGRHNEALSLPPRTSPTCAASAGPAPRCAASWSRAPRTPRAPR